MKKIKYITLALLLFVFTSLNSQNLKPVQITGEKKLKRNKKVEKKDYKVSTFDYRDDVQVSTSRNGDKYINHQKNKNVTYDKEGNVLSKDGYKIKWELPDNDTICGTPIPYIENNLGEARGGSCPIQVPCDDPANRDANIPIAATPIMHFQLRFVVIRDGGESSNISESKVSQLVSDANNAYLAHKIQFCLDTTLFVEDPTYYYFDASNEELGMKSTYGANFNNVINIYIVKSMINPSAGGYAYYPYSMYGGYSVRGGIVLVRSNVNNAKSLIHELGHTFGLRHTFHGVSEVSPCSSCYEEVGFVNGAPAFGETDGDKCSDTYPHPRNTPGCNIVGNKNSCDAFLWTNNTLNNHMSYSSASCRVQFTPQQSGRMHCMIDSYLTQWVTNGTVTCGNQPPQVDFEATPTTWPAPANITFVNKTAGSGTVTSWRWDFDVDGLGGVSPSSANTEVAPVVTYNNPGIYTVKLWAENNNGGDSLVRVAYIEVLAPTGDCDTLDFQWNTPTPNPTFVAFGAGDFMTGLPALTFNANLTDPIGVYERFDVPNPGVSTIGQVRVGLSQYANTSGSLVAIVRIYNDDGTGKPDFSGGSLGGAVIPSATLSTVPAPGVSSYSIVTIPFSEITLPGTKFHVGIEIYPGGSSDGLIVVTSSGGEGETDASNHVTTTNYGLVNLYTSFGSVSSMDRDIYIIPILGGYKPFPYIQYQLQSVVCDTTTVLIKDSVWYSEPTSMTFSFAGGESQSFTSDPGFVINKYYSDGIDTITMTAVNACARADTTSWYVKYNFLETPATDFDMNEVNPLCIGDKVNFTGIPLNMHKYTWDFGDGYIDTKEAQDTTSHVYSASGLYYVNLQAESEHYLPNDTIFYENFSTGLGGFTIIDNDGNAVHPYVSGWLNDAWVAVNPDGNGEKVFSTSLYNPPGASDDWLISPVISLNSNSVLLWDARTYDQTYKDGYEVRISTVGTSIADFMANPPLFSITEENNVTTRRKVNLSSLGFSNQNVHIAFVNNSNDKFLLSIDNIVVGSSKSACISSLLKNDFVEVVDCSIKAPKASASATPNSGCVPFNVEFSDLSAGVPDNASEWFWDFGDGDISNLQNPIHTYSDSGSFEVLFIAKNEGGGDTVYIPIDANDCTLELDGIVLKASFMGNQVLLEWHTQKENIYEKLMIEKSEDGKEFFEMENLLLNNKDKYYFIDKYPMEGSNYYRINYSLLSDKEEFSNVVSVNYVNTKSNNFTVYPNPLYNGERITVAGIEGQDYIYFELTNILGEKVLERKIINKSNNNEIDISENIYLTEGIYIYTIYNEKNKQTGRLVISEK